MLEVAVIVLLAAVSIQGDAPALDLSSQIIEATKSGNWDRVQALLNVQTQRQNLNPISAQSIKDLKPVPGGHVYGEAENAFHSWSNVNGETATQSAGHKVINDDGRVTEFNFKPDPNLPINIKGFAQNQASGQVPAFGQAPITAPLSISSGQVPISGSVPGQVLTPGQLVIPGQAPQAGQVVIPGQAPQSGQVLIPGQPPQSGQVLIPGQAPQSGQVLIPGQTPQSGQVLIPGQAPQPGQVVIPGQVPIPAQVQIPGFIQPGNVPNLQTAYSTSSSSKSHTLHTTGSVQNDPNLSQIKKAIQNNISPEGVKTLQPIPGGEVFGEAEKTYYTWTTVDGKTTVQTHGHKVVNKNGQVTEYDFKPATNNNLNFLQGVMQNNNLSADKIKNLKPIPGGHVYGEAESNFQAWTNINGQTSEKAGGHKVINDDGKITEYNLQPNKKP